MKNTILFLSLAFSLNSFAGSVDVRCTKLVDGNLSKNAYTTVKAVDFNFSLNEEVTEAEFKGNYVSRAGQYHRENESVNFYTSFYKTKFSVRGDEVSASMHESSFWVCGSGGTPCHEWRKFTYNKKTKEGTLAQSHSYSNFGKNESVSLSIKFNCL